MELRVPKPSHERHGPATCRRGRVLLRKCRLLTTRNPLASRSPTQEQLKGLNQYRFQGVGGHGDAAAGISVRLSPSPPRRHLAAGHGAARWQAGTRHVVAAWWSARDCKFDGGKYHQRREEEFPAVRARQLGALKRPLESKR